jgi:hypothetical protein
MRARRRPATLGIAVGGVLAGHWLTYVAVAPAEEARAAILHHTGHAYIGMANDLGLVVALTAMAAMFVGQLTGPGQAHQLRGTTVRVVRFQVCAFIILEVLERLTAGSPLAELVRSGVLPIGIAAQIAVGCVAGSAIAWLHRAADRVAAAFGRAAAPIRLIVRRPVPPEVVVVRATHQLSATGVRGPPPSV